ncbi:6-pyruvoyl trahydropterin synthase family protein [Amphibiibacter pelophylacis]|uniref:6-carboxytetrahydropterin synthase n=1 Tax=Amphibiibacter pelophylacis TaxID=1799477 RepID=A0ACC6P0E3_9BURK
MFELSQEFHFDAAHTLHRPGVDPQEMHASLRIHGHSYTATVTLRGERDSGGMLLDLGVLRRCIERVRARLDHHHLDHVEGLGPATLENLCVFIHQHLHQELQAAVGDAGAQALCRVAVRRPTTGDACVYTPG